MPASQCEMLRSILEVDAKMKSSVQLERQVERIHKALERTDATVTWNERIPDPDNPGQPRQIDVSIRRGNSLTIVECRLHRRPQDVNWIEELAGRRLSFRADAVIAVSASGFTIGARRKASAIGVVLRQLEELSDDEIQNWGRQVGVQLTTCRFLECSFSALLTERPSNEVALSTADGNDVNLLPLFGRVMNSLREQGADTGRFEIELLLDRSYLVGAIQPVQLKFSAKVELLKRDLQLASVLAYASPGKVDADIVGHVQRYDLDAVEVVDGADRLGIILDLSSPGIGMNEYFDHARFDTGNIRQPKWIEVVGLGSLTYTGPVELHLKFTRDKCT